MPNGNKAVIFDYFFKFGVIVLTALGGMVFSQVSDNQVQLAKLTVHVKNLDRSGDVTKIQNTLNEIDKQVQSMARDYAVLRYKVFRENPD